MGAISWLVVTLANLVQFVLLVYIIMGWLYRFNAIPSTNQVLAQIYGVAKSLSTPMLDPVRRYIPSVGGVDLSPLVVFLAAEFIKRLFSGGF